jgi:mannosyl-3-phosphoglycerate phosphatase
MAGDRPLWWRNTLAQPAAGPAARLIVVTDVEASFLEPGRRTLADECAALDFLAARGIPLVINSSRTRAEIERLHATLRLLTPFICEHGSALVIPDGCFPSIPPGASRTVGGHVIVFGRPYHEVVDAVRLAGRELDVDILGFADLTIDDVARELGVTTVEAQLAKLREYTELIRLDGDNHAARSRLFNALRRRGLRCSPTGRHHLVSATRNRAESLLTLRTLWRHAWGEVQIVGFGDSDDDVSWLRHADVAVVVRNERRGLPLRLLSKLPAAQVTRLPGGLGWSDAILACVGALLNPRQPALLPPR